jgi:hypothetical protein
MTSMEVPKIKSLSAVGDPLANIPGVFSFLLTSLLSHEQALLHAEYNRPAPETSWHLRPRTKEQEGEDEVIATLPSSILQSCAARIAVHMGVLQTGSGHGRVLLSQEGRQHNCQVFVSNCGESGCWLRIYAKAQHKD